MVIDDSKFGWYVFGVIALIVVALVVTGIVMWSKSDPSKAFQNRSIIGNLADEKKPRRITVIKR